ncbi:MAG: peptide chain release factor 1 [Chlamydiae bacterium RIFCSPHIGHO2_12_FULL_44_59]|nr:MAG: peptide chain release factor 1 [Chlamydiae bacterium RIFCSPHIGHO2_01_FULL_44_39]OGN60280.1 MAG: peptide chain release factor 1 [Chlamydiae bacterium RIFCSPHIGHO2_12_FULL_44_59]OGN67067.1 MAG: peptide chain release factor 1 [Chlamydiae bacterium RIFCSPLOWO2_01_FULL_44_52]OGN67657.1 MAG: peptide chain release factor 1 [Chlamydiae bacterium RIFCSPLOWO2_02_FULL_45_22]OGN71360.1 MAG: peptide chain release factor 1 [Chlamydiae bacterium RIFCSPLOWO2_12_FULL_45_20]
MREKVQRLLNRLIEVEELLGHPEILSDQKKYRVLTQEHSQLADLKDAWDRLQRSEKELDENRQLESLEKDPAMLILLQEENIRLLIEVEAAQKEIETLLVPPDPRDSRNIILEIRAGTGGDEAALFVADCVRMYQYYANQKGWKTEVLSTSESEIGGFKEYIMSLSGPNVFRLMQYEAGTHRVQRVPATETQGRVHTSAVTMAVLLEPDEDEKVLIDEKDLKIDTYRASGAGGQHVNRTDSAVRITHVPTGTVVTCQEERSQHKNKEKAMRYLESRIAEEIRKKSQQELSEIRQLQVGTGDRSERIRTYNYPQNRVTDHRIDLTLYILDRIMEGDLDALVTILVNRLYEQKLKS